jgi:hypothetical protein
MGPLGIFIGYVYTDTKAVVIKTGIVIYDNTALTPSY